MKRFQRPFKVLFTLFMAFLLFGCMPKMIVKETTHYKLYENIVLVASATTFGNWIKSDIQIPEGAIVAVMAKGKILDITDPGKWHWQPHQCLRFKIGEDGRETHIEAGINPKDPFNVNVMPSGNGGPLYLGMGTWWKLKYPQNKWGKIVVRVIIWEKERQDRIEHDLLELIRSNPNDQQFRGLVAFMAICLKNMREFEKVQSLHKMIRDNPEMDWDRVYPEVLNQSGDVERILGRGEKAKAYSEEALKRIRRFGNRHTEAITLRTIALAAQNLGQYEEANQLVEQSLQIAKELKHPELIGIMLLATGENLLRMDRPAEAVKQFEDALEYFNKGDRWLNRRWCHLNLGESHRRLNEDAEAKKSFESAIEVSVKACDPLSQLRGHVGLGRIAEKEGDNQKAFEHYAKAIAIIESIRSKFKDPGLKSLFMKGNLRVYERMIQLLQKMKRAPEALHYLERARARVMLDMLAEKVFSSKNREENELLTRERALRRRADEISIGQERIGSETFQEIGEEISEVQGSEKQISELERVQAQHRPILKRIEELNPELASLITINPLKAGEIRALLDSDTILIEYFIGVQDRFIFVVTKEKVLAVPLEIDSEKLFQKVREFRVRAVERITLDRLLSKAYERPLSELYEILIQPMEKEIFGKKNLIIVPHGMLHYLPFQALLSGDGKYLIESFSISYLPSATILKYARAKNKGNRRDLFAAGNPSTELSSLPAAEMEVKEVSAIFEEKLILTGQQATKISVKHQSSQYDMILLSTHGEMIESDPLKSNLRFTPSDKDDGRLTVSEIFDMEIKANLVTLSACETALVKGETGGFPQGDDLVGLSRAFIHAGAPSVVASLWKVSDDSTIKLMKTFYQNLKSMPKAEALRKAQLDLMKSTVHFTVTRAGGGMIQPAQKGSEETIECSHPFFWAPFILLGDWM